MTRSIYSEPHKALVGCLIQARHDAGLRQEDLADRLGKPQSFVSKVERGERRLDLVEFLILARAVGADPKAILDSVSEVLTPADRI